MTHDFRFALRSIWRNRLFALTALVAFSFGIGATTTVFSVIDAVLLRPATFPHSSSVVNLQAAEKNKEWDNITPWVFDRIRSRADLFSQVAGSRTALFTVTRVPVPDQVFGLSVSGNLFTMLAARPWQGRLLLPEDDKPGAPAVALLSYKGWQKLFSGDPKVVGKTAEIDGEPYTIIGVMPLDFVLPGSQGSGALWTTLRLTPAELTAPNARSVQVIARLRSSVTAANAQAALNALASSLTANSGPGHALLRFRVSPWRNKTDATQKLTLWLAMGMVSGLLLIGCANLSSILLARAISRRRDYVIRLATGASRMQLIRQSLLEVLLLALAALAVASIGTSAALHLIRDHLSAVQTGIPNLARIQVNLLSFFFSFTVAVLAALMCGLFPALSATSINLSTGLRETSTQIASARPVRRFLYSLVAAEAGLSMLLLLTSGLLVRSLVRLISEDHGLRPDRVLTLRLPTGSWQRLSRKQTSEEQQGRIQHYLELLRQAEAIRGVQAAALASSLPLSHTVVTTRLYAPHQVASAGTPQIGPTTQAVTRDYFRVMGIPLLSGRTFEARDAASKQRLALVNQAFARQYFLGENPVGKFLSEPENKETLQIIGVVKDSPHLDLAEKIKPEVYLNFEQTLLTPFLTGLVVRTQENPQSLSSTLRSALSMRNTDQAVVQVQTLQALMDENIWLPRFSAWLFSIFASLALCLSGIGIYGVVAYVAASRRRDFGIRVALGANPGSVFRLATLQSLTPVVLGASFGALGSYGTSRWISSLLYKTSPFDLTAVCASAAILLFLALAATVGPALRAARVDPAMTLRSE